MKTYFNEKDMTDFANYVNSKEVKEKKQEVNKNVTTHADFENWKLNR